MEEVPVAAAQAFEAAVLALIERAANVAKLGCGSAEERRRVDGKSAGHGTHARSVA
jgi:hypothetical protein